MQLAASTLDEALGRKEGLARDYNNLGIIYKTRGELDRAENMQLKSLALNQTLGKREGIATDYGNLARIYMDKKDCLLMCDCGRKARDLWREVGIDNKFAEADQWLRDNGCDAT